ncbi:MAG: sporulation transcriptional regulator SpoIIID [Clostridia bacterium]|nr:sporulation transcriptional regulator SpoIIID [Clostridia bacterium]
MREFSDDRAILLAQHIIETGNTVRATAKVFGISKSTVQTDVTISNGLSGKWLKPSTNRIK